MGCIPRTAQKEKEEEEFTRTFSKEDMQITNGYIKKTCYITIHWEGQGIVKTLYIVVGVLNYV